MNNQLIEKVIKTHHKTCPPMIYDNPLIDREVARALAKSFMKILNLSNQRNFNNNLRYSILRSIRKICQLHPENHVKVSENLIQLLIELYVKLIEDSSKTDQTDKTLDEFLMRNINDLNLSSNHVYSVNPEVIQSLLNLSDGHTLELLTKNILHLSNNKKNVILLKSLWSNNSLESANINDTSIKLKTDMEHTLLEICYEVLINKELNYDLFQAENINCLIRKCAKSSQCFQLCSQILNCLLVETSFNVYIQNFITLFIKEVQSYSNQSISVLYAHHLGCLVLLMDIDINSLPDYVKTNYIQKVVNLLRDIKIENGNDVIMLLSHFPHWFDIYCNIN